MNPIDYISLLQKNFPPEEGKFTPPYVLLIAIDHALTIKYKLTVYERAFIFGKAYYPEFFSPVKVTGLSLKRYTFQLSDQYKTTLKQVIEKL